MQQPTMPPLVADRLRDLKRELEDLEWSDSTSPLAGLRRRNLRGEIARLQDMHRKGEIYDPQH